MSNPNTPIDEITNEQKHNRVASVRMILEKLENFEQQQSTLQKQLGQLESTLNHSLTSITQSLNGWLTTPPQLNIQIQQLTAAITKQGESISQIQTMLGALKTQIERKVQDGSGEQGKAIQEFLKAGEKLQSVVDALATGQKELQSVADQLEQITQSDSFQIASQGIQKMQETLVTNLRQKMQEIYNGLANIKEGPRQPSTDSVSPLFSDDRFEKVRNLLALFNFKRLYRK